nr:transposase [Oceanococcus sp. HetDA_MAG_MS8]
MPKPGPRTTYRYSEEFKATAVRLSELQGVAIKDVAASLAIHPFMLSRWRKQVREGLIVTKGVEVEKDVSAELKELRQLKKDYARLQLEHRLLKKPSRSVPNKKRGLRFHPTLPRTSASDGVVPAAWSESRGLLRLAPTPSK